ncbi:MAG: hypothetical protein B0W54_02095 [Cellvibrio sp. 79]|nr:MAG: hypothetical protein B0W54_02095 [Cellvibrio sp. 79]
MIKHLNNLTILFIALVYFSSGSVTAEDNSKALETIFSEDQKDRKIMTSGQAYDWESIAYRDEEREKAVRELIEKGKLQTGEDYYHAAMILQHGTSPEDHLLAHDLCVVAISKGEEKAKWLAAASLDRFLIGIGRNQRYGTQFRSDRSFNPPRLVPIDKDVPDALRIEMNVPTLKEARKVEKQMIKSFNENRNSNKK